MEKNKLAELIQEGIVTPQEWATYQTGIQEQPLLIYKNIVGDYAVFKCDEPVSYILAFTDVDTAPVFENAALGEISYQDLLQQAEYHECSVIINPGFHCVIEDAAFGTRYMADVDISGFTITQFVDAGALDKPVTE